MGIRVLHDFSLLSSKSHRNTLLGKVYTPPSNYHIIDNIPPKFSIVTMSLTNYKKLSIFLSIMKLPLVKTKKKNTKLLKKNIKLKTKK